MSSALSGVQASVDALRIDVRADASSLRNELRADGDKLRNELRADMGELRAGMARANKTLDALLLLAPLVRKPE